MWQLHRIRRFRSVLTQDACATLILGLVMSHLDYCNAIYIGIPKCDLNRLQRIQNIAARLVLNDGTSSYDSLKRLHWLPVHLRIQHKVLTILYKVLHHEAPPYLQDLIQVEEMQRTGLRSGRSTKLSEPRTKRQTFGARSFSAVAPRWWNGLPEAIKAADTVDIFKSRLKTFLFAKF